MNAALQIMRIAVRELLYERVFYLLLGFLLVATGLSLLLGQLTYAEQAKMTFDFLLAGIQIAMVLFSVFMGIFLFQRELSLGSISMVLSKPISRTAFVLGKFLGQISIQALVAFLMAAITYAFSRLLGATPSVPALFQAVTLILCEAAVLASIAYFFAVNAGAMTTATATLFLFLLGHSRSGISSNLRTDSENTLWAIVKGAVPDLEIFNMKALASYNQALGWTEFGWALVYAVITVGFFLSMASFCFEKKDVLT